METEEKPIKPSANEQIEETTSTPIKSEREAVLGANKIPTVNVPEATAAPSTLNTISPKAGAVDAYAAVLKNEREQAAATGQDKDNWVRDNLRATYGSSLQTGANGLLYGDDGNSNPVQVIETKRDEYGDTFSVINLKGRKYKYDTESNSWTEYVEPQQPTAEYGTPEWKEAYRKKQSDAAVKEIFDYFDADGGVNGNTFNGLTGDNMRTIIDLDGIVALKRRYGIKGPISRDKLLQMVKDEYAADKQLQSEGVNNVNKIMQNVTFKSDRPIGQNTNGKILTLPAEKRNDIFKKIQGYELSAPSEMAYRTGDDVIAHQNWQYDTIANDPALLEKFKKDFPAEIDASGNLKRINTDSKDGQYTEKVNAWLLLQSMGEDGLHEIGKQYNPQTGLLEDFEPDPTYLTEFFTEKKLRKEKDFERKRNERQKAYAAIGNLVMTIGDTIGTSVGLKAADRSELNAMQDNLEKKYYEIRKDYDQRLDTLRQEREKARSDREKMRFDIYKNKLQHEQQQELLQIQQAFNAAENAKNRALTSSEGDKNRQNALDIAKLKAAAQEAIYKNKLAAKAAGSYDTVQIGQGYINVPKGTKGFYYQSIAGQLTNPAVLKKIGIDKATVDNQNGDKIPLSDALRQAQSLEGDASNNSIISIISNLYTNLNEEQRLKFINYCADTATNVGTTTDDNTDDDTTITEEEQIIGEVR